MKINSLANQKYSPHKTTRRNFGISSIALKYRLYYGRKRKNFTGKEQDPETGLYYYGARYLDPKTSRWLSGDPAMGEYFPVAPVNDEARKRNGNLPGQGGVFNYVNLHAYHYAGNNPVKYVDPDGNTSSFPVTRYECIVWNRRYPNNDLSGLKNLSAEMVRTGKIGDFNLYIDAISDGCFARASLISYVLAIKGYNVSYVYAHKPLSFDPKKKRFEYHIAVAVTIDGTLYVIDPYYSGMNGHGITTYNEWIRKQDPKGNKTMPADKDLMQTWYDKYNKNENLSVQEYAEKWLKHFYYTGEYNYNGFDQE